jgi:hypothetical protein
VKISSRQFSLLALLQVCGFAGVFAWRFYVTAKAYLAHPTDDALWAHNWTAQVAGFGVFVAPLFLVSLGVLIVVEYLVWRLVSGRRQRGQRPSA